MLERVSISPSIYKLWANTIFRRIHLSKDKNMKRKIDWRENLSYIFLEKGYNKEEPIIPGGSVRWMLLSKMLPDKFYVFVGDKTTPCEAHKISGSSECPLMKQKKCQYFKSNKLKQIKACRQICTGAEFKLLRPSKATEWGSEYRPGGACSEQKSETNSIINTEGQLLFVIPSDLLPKQYKDNGYIVLNEHTGEHVVRLFDSEAEAQKREKERKIKKKESQNATIDNPEKLCFYSRVCQFIRKCIQIDYQNPMLYKIDDDFLNKIKIEFVGKGGKEIIGKYKPKVTSQSEKDYVFDFKGFRRKLHGRKKENQPREYENIIKNNYNIKKEFGRPFFSKREFLNYLNRADEALEIHINGTNPKDTTSSSKGYSKKDFEQRFNFLIALIMIQYILNDNDYIKKYFINPGSAAQDDKDLYEKT